MRTGRLSTRDCGGKQASSATARVTRATVHFVRLFPYARSGPSISSNRRGDVPGSFFGSTRFGRWGDAALRPKCPCKSARTKMPRPKSYQTAQTAEGADRSRKFGRRARLRRRARHFGSTAQTTAQIQSAATRGPPRPAGRDPRRAATRWDPAQAPTPPTPSARRTTTRRRTTRRPSSSASRGRPRATTTTRSTTTTTRRRPI